MADLIKKIKKFPYVLAPLAGYSDYPFRMLAKKFGATLVFTEMVNVHSMLKARDKIKNHLYYHKKEHPIGLQIFGNDSKRFCDAAKAGVELGFDLIDINFGCPVKKVVKNKSGAYLHKDLKAVEETIISAVKGAGKTPVSIKMRSGWDEENKNFIKIAKIAEDNGVKIITLHPRTRAQMFKGKASWQQIAELKRKSSLFIIGNGDVKTAEDAKRMKKETGCDAVMIGRAAIGNPFIFKQIKDKKYEPSLKEKVKTAVEHLEMLAEFKGKQGILEMRKYYARYIKGFEGVSGFRKKLMTLENVAMIKRELDELV